MDPKLRQSRLKALLKMPQPMDHKSGNRILPCWPRPATAVSSSEPISSSANDKIDNMSKFEVQPSQESQFRAEAGFFEDFPSTQPDKLEVQPSQETQFAAETGFSCFEDFPATQPTVYEDLLNTQLAGSESQLAETLLEDTETQLEETTEVMEEKAVTDEGKKRTSTEAWPAGFFSEASIAQRKKSRQMLSAA